MSSNGGRDAAFDGAGLCATILTASLVVVGIVRIVAPLPAPSPLLLLFSLALAIGAITMVCRFRVPNPVRAVLILALVVILLAMTAMGDLFGMRGAEGEIANSMVADPTVRPDAPQAGHTAPVSDAPTVPAPLPEPAGGGAAIRLEPDANGDKGWAARIDTALDRRIGGAAAADYAITGTVGMSMVEAEDRLAMAWSIGLGDKIVRCGVTSLVKPNPAMVVDQLEVSLRRAIERSIKTGAPACF